MTEAPIPKVNVNYGNSNKAKAAVEPVERQKLEKVVDGVVTQKKKSLGRKIADNFSGENMQTIGSYIFFDVIVPQAKDMIMDALTTGAQRAMYGDAHRSQRTGGGIGRPTAYNRMYNNKPEPRVITQQARASHEFGDFVLETRPEAEKVLDGLLELIDKYGFASVADLYDLLGQTSDFTDGKHGWSDLRAASVSRQRAGYVLDLPRTQPID